MYKQVIVIRKDLGMGKGKIAAQVAHASLEAYKRADREDVDEWERDGTKKVVVKADGLMELMKIRDMVKSMGLAYYVVRDAGKSQISPGTVTAIGIGPATEGEIDKITKDLKLL